ncbi:MAG: hypothetical protein ABSG03_34505 [Bryobacteraceae bacterium]
MRHKLAIPLVMALAIACPVLQAKTPPKAEPSKLPEVVAHIPLSSATVQMFTRRDDKGRLYLYALHPAGVAVSVVDITNAARPALVTQVAYPSPIGYGNVQTIGTNTALVELPDQSAAPSNPAPVKTLALLDTSDPAAPRITLRFSGVTAVARDDSRSLLFIANKEGLWIVRHYEPPDKGVAAWENFVSAR